MVLGAVPEVEGFSKIESIGRGGTSLVFKAIEDEFDRTVALKVLDIPDEAAAKRFEREQRAMGRLSELDGVVTVYQTVRTDSGRPCLVLPYYEAGSLQDRINRGAVPWVEAASLMAEVSETLASAHSMGVIHRDLKPANILVNDAGAPRIADFGIARVATDETASQSMSLTFTPAYSAPESFTSDVKPTAATDVYGLGATLWALIAGRAPFGGSGEAMNVMAIINRVATELPGSPSPDCPEGLSAAINQAMAKEAGDRFSDASEFAAVLRAAVASPDAAADADLLATVSEVTPFVVPRIPGAETVATPADSAPQSIGGDEPPAESEGSAGSQRRVLVLGAAAILLLAIGGIVAAAVRSGGGGDVLEVAGTSTAVSSNAQLGSDRDDEVGDDEEDADDESTATSSRSTTTQEVSDSEASNDDDQPLGVQQVTTTRVTQRTTTTTRPPTTAATTPTTAATAPTTASTAKPAPVPTTPTAEPPEPTSPPVDPPTPTTPTTEPPPEYSLFISGPGSVTCWSGNYNYSVGNNGTASLTSFNWNTQSVGLQSGWQAGPGAVFSFDMQPGTYSVFVTVNGSQQTSRSITVNDDGNGCTGP